MQWSKWRRATAQTAATVDVNQRAGRDVTVVGTHTAVGNQETQIWGWGVGGVKCSRGDDTQVSGEKLRHGGSLK